MFLKDMALQDNFGTSRQRDSGDESTTSSFGSPSGGLHLLWSAVQEVTSSSESDSASCDMTDQTPLSTMSTLDQSGAPNTNAERAMKYDKVAMAAAVSRGRRAAARARRQAQLDEQAMLPSDLNESPFIDLDSVAPLGKREQTALSCVRCRTTHKKCDETRPCQRCIRIGCENDCHDAAPRGAKPKPKGALPVSSCGLSAQAETFAFAASSSKQKQRTQPTPHKNPFSHYSTPDAGYITDRPPALAEYKLPAPPTGFPLLSEWPPRQLHYHPQPQLQPYTYYPPSSCLAPLPSSISSSSGSSSAGSSLSPPRLPLPSLNESDRNSANDVYSLPYLPPPARPYYTMNPFNHSPALFR